MKFVKLTRWYYDRWGSDVHGTPVWVNVATVTQLIPYEWYITTSEGDNEILLKDKTYEKLTEIVFAAQGEEGADSIQVCETPEQILCAVKSIQQGDIY